MKVVLRAGKVHAGEVAKVHNHNQRTYENQSVDNIDFSRTAQNEVLLGSKDTHKILKDKLAENTNKRALRKDAAVMCEFIFSASSEFFYKNLDKEKFETLTMKDNKKELSKIFATLDKEKLEQFKSTVVKYCQEEFKNNIVNITLHLDEKTPHIHCLVVPKTPDNRVCMKEFFTPTNARAWQDTFAVACKPLGLSRGDPESTAVHTSHHTYNEALISAVQPEVPKFKDERPDPLKPSQIFGKKLGFKTQLISTEEILENRDKREVALKKEVDFFKSHFKKSQREVAKGKIAESQIEQYKKENLALKNQNKKFTENQMENFRHIPLKEVAEQLGCVFVKESATTYRCKTSRMNLVIDTAKNQYFDNKKNLGAFGSINMLVDVFDYKAKNAIDFLATRTTTAKISNEILSSKTTTADIIKDVVKSTTSEQPTPVAKNLPKVLDYLTNTRKIDISIAQPLVEQGLIFADSRNNVIFSNEQKTFCSIRGTQEKKFSICKGEPDFIKFDFNSKNSNTVYLFESPIDALSYRQLNPTADGVYAITNGNTIINRTPQLTKNFAKVVCCFDNDEAGKKFDEIVKKGSPGQVEVQKPISKDFNEDLKQKIVDELKSKPIEAPDQIKSRLAQQAPQKQLASVEAEALVKKFYAEQPKKPTPIKFGNRR